LARSKWSILLRVVRLSLHLLCISLSASLFYVVRMAYKKAYRSTNRLIDQAVGSPQDELKLYLSQQTMSLAGGVVKWT
jgi:hypothetical protein